MPAQLARARAHVYDVVRRADGVLVMLHHDDGVALVPQALEGGDEAVVVALVKPDGGLVQNVEHAHEAGADLRGQADALRLAAGEGGRGAGQREVVEAHVDQEAQARADLLDDGPGNDQLALLEIEPVEELQALLAGELADVPDALAAHGDGQDLRLQAGTVARGAGHLADVLLQVGAHGLRRGLLVFVKENLAHARERGEPAGVAPVARVVVHADLLVSQAAEKDVLRLLGQL